MKYPKFLKKNDLIGITALSSGCSDSLNEMHQAIINLEQSGFKVITTNNVFGNYLVSSDTKTRIGELHQLLKEDIKLLQIARGGNFFYELLEMLPYEEIVKRGLMVQGYSDPTSLLYILTTKYDLATVYGMNGKSYSDTPLLTYELHNLEILQGNLLMQKSFDRESVSVNGDFESNGIIIGGCLEVLKDLIGTRFDETKTFIEKYREYGIIWYFDIYNMKPSDVYLTLLQFKNAGWFKYSDTFLIGKVLLKQAEDIMTYREAYEKALVGNIVYDTNIGHVKPVFTIINGSLASVSYCNHQLSLGQELLK